MTAGAPRETADFRDAALVAALRSGDERAFLALVEALHGPMVRFARTWAGSYAEDAVQDTWAAVLQGLDGFEGRASLRSWIFGVLANQARAKGAREGRTIPLSALGQDDDEPAVDPTAFLARSHARWGGHWARWPEPWPDGRLMSEQALKQIAAAIESLPPAQRAVIQLRDVEEWTAEEVCEALGLSEGNQRVLLHRARSKVRAALDRVFGEARR
jgi:RNA polymerase sigma-70 factor (ECF subfamily)